MDSSPSQFTLVQTSPLIEFPHSLPRYMGKNFLARRQRELYVHATKTIDETQTLTSDHLSLLQWYHQILELILFRPNLPAKLQANIAYEAPMAAYNAMITDYPGQPAHVLELSLLPKPEYVCKLLLWAQENHVRLRYAENMYFPTLYADFYWAHYFYKRRPSDNFFERMVRFNLDYQQISPSAILTLGCLGHINEFSDTHIEMLAQEPSIAFQAAAMFPQRMPLDALLKDAASIPQWAYHILIHIKKGLPADIRALCMTTLEYSPPWLIEYLAATKLFETDVVLAKQLLADSLKTDHVMCADILAGLTPLLAAA